MGGGGGEHMPLLPPPPPPRFLPMVIAGFFLTGRFKFLLASGKQATVKARFWIVRLTYLCIFHLIFFISGINLYSATAMETRITLMLTGLPSSSSSLTVCGRLLDRYGKTKWTNLFWKYFCNDCLSCSQDSNDYSLLFRVYKLICLSHPIQNLT